jgi:chromate transporter
MSTESSDSSKDAQPAAVPPPPAPRYSLGELTLYFLKLGSLGFGGPVALVGYMHRDLVEERAWITEDDYKEGLALAQLAPGPLAAQLAIYLGYVHYGVLGATVAGVAFVVPSFLMVVALGWAYVEYGGLSWMQAVFFGVGPCVIGIIAHSAYQMTRKSIGRDWLLWVVYLISAATTIVTESEIVWLFLGAGILVWLVRQPPKLFGRSPMMLALALFAWQDLEQPAQPLGEKLWEILVFFTKAGAFVFGSGLAIVPFLYGGVVKEYGWLNDQQFLDAVAVAMITPGPVVITVGFIGYLIAGFWGACAAALGTFLPCYLFTIIPAPYFKKYGHRPGIKAFVDGITAAAVGAIAGAVVVLGRRTILDESWQPDLTKCVLFACTLVVLSSPRKIPEPIVVLVAAILGLILFPLVRN